MRQDAGAVEGEFHDALERVPSVVEGLWERDETTWPPVASGPRATLGWLDAPTTSRAAAGSWHTLAAGLVADGVTDVLVLGMGGASRHARVLAANVDDPLLALHVLDTTHPDAVARRRAAMDPATWALLVVSKSGTTVETRAQFERFWADLVEARGEPGAGERVVVVTDAGSELEDLAVARRARAVVHSRPDTTGRFAALTAVGQVPAALLGVDVAAHLDSADEMLRELRSLDPTTNAPARLGAFMAANVVAGRSQLTVVMAPEDRAFGAWLEQLVAESTGKGGAGLLPVLDEPVLEPAAYGPLRSLVAIGDHHGVRAVADAGTPVATLDAFDLDGLAGEVVRWQAATAIACALMGVNAFDQPDVDAARQATDTILATGGQSPARIEAAELVEQLDRADWMGLVAWVDPESDAGEDARDAARVLRRRFGIPVTLGFGPRHLHAAGQLHKGGPPGGVFAVVVDTGNATIPIPGRDIDFTELLLGQAAGDVQALRDAGRVAGVVDLQDLLDA